VFALVTDLLDPLAYPALDLARAYPLRWEAEMSEPQCSRSRVGAA
jgi:hypothetical protein